MENAEEATLRGRERHDVRPSFFGLGLARSRDRRVVAGVAGGLAERLRVDPALIRVAFVLLALCGGAGVLAYTVLWVTVPQADGPAPVLDAGTQ
ncbi:MAG TPA: PspC domain-containing protein, partial [Actinomycetota bacterium]|nr:PspC domain-containing protein [Actinomycetota bacterium]